MKNNKKAIGIIVTAIMLISVFVAIAPTVSATEAGDLEAIQKAIEESGAEWQADYTSTSGLSLEEKQQLCGLKISESMKNMIKSTSSVQRSRYDENAMKNMIESASSAKRSRYDESAKRSRYDESATNEMGIASIDTTMEVPKTSSLAGYNIAVVNAGYNPGQVELQLEAWGATVDLINVPAITASLLSSYDLVWIPYAAAGAVDAGGKAAEILSYVQNGGGEILAQPGEVMTPQCLPYTWQIVGVWWEEPPCAATIVDPTHELTAGLTVDDMPDCFDDVGTVASEYTILALSGAGDASFGCANYGDGRVIVEMDCPLGPGICDVCDDCPSLSEAMVTTMVEWVTTIPCDAFDWRDYLGGDWTTSIKDQGPCGSCWAFGSLAAMEAHIDLQKGDPTFNQDLSEQQLLSCSPGDCSGWYEDKVLDWLRDEGTVDEACFPYEANDTVPCDDHCPDWESRIWKITDWGWVAPTISAITGRLHDAPLVTGMAVYEDFHSYKGGIYEHVWGDLLGYHLVSMVGYDECEDYWICKNSWGPDWGEEGWFRIRYGQCKIETWNAYIVPPIIPNGECSVSIDSASAPQGGTVTVPINIVDVGNMCGANIWLNYNKDVVIVDSVSEGDLVPLTYNIDNTAGVTKITWDTTSGKTGDFVFADVTLKAVGNTGDTCLLDIDVKELYDCDLVEIPRTVVDGTFEVPPPLMEGDVTDLNVCVSLKDSTLIKFYLVDMATLTPDQLECADTTDDGEVTLKDSTAIKFWLVNPDYPLWKSPADDHMMKPVPCFFEPLATSTASTNVSIDDTSAPPGGTVTVPINIADVENMYGASIWLNYNKNVVTVDSVSDGDLVPLTHNIDNTAGVTKINWDTTSGETGDFVLAYVTLKAVGNTGDTCLLDIDVKELYDCDLVEIPRTVAGGTFTVRAN